MRARRRRWPRRRLPPRTRAWAWRAPQPLAMIALARHDERGARAEAALANEIDPELPLPDYIEGLIRYRTNQFAAAVPYLEQALKKSAGRTVQIPELRYHLGDALA